MKKKLIGLSMLLLVLLLGLSTTSYAEISLVQLKNLIVSGMINSGWTQENAMNFVDTKFNVDSTYIDNPTYKIIAVKDGTTIYIYFYDDIGNNGKMQCYSYNNNTLWRFGSIKKKYEIAISVSNNGSYQTNNVPNNSFYGTTNKSPLFLYTQDSMYTDTNYTTIRYNAGYISNFSLDGYYSSEKPWGVYSYPYEEIYTIPNLTINGSQQAHRSEFNGTGVSALSNGWSTAFFGGLDEFDHARATYYRYDNYVKQWRLQDRTDEAIIWGEDEEDNSFWLYIPCPYYYGDSVVLLTIFHKTEPTKNYQITLYLKTSNTVINNGVIAIEGTISNYSYSGDNGYINNSNTINNQNDTQSIVDTLTDDSQVDGMLSEFTNGDSDDMANKLGYTPFANPFTSFLQNIFNGIIDALLNDQDVQLNFGFGGKNYYVSSADFTTPENNTFINLAKWALIFAYIYGVYRFGWLKIQKLSEFDLDKSGSYTTSERPGRITYGEEELPFDML